MAQTQEQLKIACYSKEISTRMLAETALDRDFCDLVFVPNEEELLKCVQKRTHDIYIIDTCHETPENRLRLLRLAVSQKLNGIVRIMLIIDRVPPEQSAGMQPFGPMCMIECFFTRYGIRAAIEKLLALKDTGSRVKADDKFFDITVFKNKVES